MGTYQFDQFDTLALHHYDQSLLSPFRNYQELSQYIHCTNIPWKRCILTSFNESWYCQYSEKLELPVHVLPIMPTYGSHPYQVWCPFSTRIIRNDFHEVGYQFNGYHYEIRSRIITWTFEMYVYMCVRLCLFLVNEIQKRAMPGHQRT